MSLRIPFNGPICFTGAPESGLETLAVRVHCVTEATTGGGIPFFDLSLWTHADSTCFRDGPQRAQQLLSVADTFLGVNGPHGEEQGFQLLRGPADCLALAAMQGITLPTEMHQTCSRLVDRCQLFAFQLPDRERWRSRGYDARTANWFLEYTRTVLRTLQDHGLRMKQFCALPPQRGDSNGVIIDACWRLFGVAPSPLDPTQRIEPLASVLRGAKTLSGDAFQMKVGTPLGPPHVG